MYKDVVKTTNIVKPLGRDIIRHTYIVNSLGIDIMRHNKIQKNKHVIGGIHMSASAANRTGPRKHPTATHATPPSRHGKHPTRLSTHGPWPAASLAPVSLFVVTEPSRKPHAPTERRHVGHPEMCSGHHKKPAPTDWRKATIGKINVIHTR